MWSVLITCARRTRVEVGQFYRHIEPVRLCGEIDRQLFIDGRIELANIFWIGFTRDGECHASSVQMDRRGPARRLKGKIAHNLHLK